MWDLCLHSQQNLLLTVCSLQYLEMSIKYNISTAEIFNKASIYIAFYSTRVSSSSFRLDTMTFNIEIYDKRHEENFYDALRSTLINARFISLYCEPFYYNWKYCETGKHESINVKPMSTLRNDFWKMCDIVGVPHNSLKIPFRQKWL